jgi:REP element-mobilizing transposase RayT
MPRGLRRYYGKGHLHFVTFSCYRRLPLLRNARARDIVVRELARVRDELGFPLAGYVVMPEHVHLLLGEPKDGTPSTVLHRLKLRAARKLRKRLGRVSRETNALAFRRAWATVAILLAGTVLRLQCLEREEVSRKTRLHAPKSRGAETRPAPRGLRVCTCKP